MKVRISATIEEETDKVLDKVLAKGRYRNKSHLIEEALTRFLEEKGHES